MGSSKPSPLEMAWASLRKAGFVVNAKGTSRRENATNVYAISVTTNENSHHRRYSSTVQAQTAPLAVSPEEGIVPMMGALFFANRNH